MATTCTWAQLVQTWPQHVSGTNLYKHRHMATIWSQHVSGPTCTNMATTCTNMATTCIRDQLVQTSPHGNNMVTTFICVQPIQTWQQLVPGYNLVKHGHNM